MRPRLPLFALGLMLLAVPASAQTTQYMTQRKARLKQNARTLQQAHIPGYGVTFSRSGRSVKPIDRSGAMVVAAVDQSSMARWKQTVGQHSIGFITSAGCASSPGGSSGYVRIGNTFMDYSWVRSSYGSACDIANKSTQYTEATYMVTPQEMAAFKAFYHARNRKLIKDSKGCTMAPVWNYPGPSNTKREGCAGAASSGLNPSWVRAFGRNVRAIKAYGAQNNIAELRDVPDNAAQLMMNFIKRVGAKQQTDPRTLVRYHAPTADMVTLFNQNLGQNPIQSTTWNRNVVMYTSPRTGRRYRDKHHPTWNGLGRHHTIFDRNPGESNASKTWNAQRMSLSQFAGAQL